MIYPTEVTDTDLVDDVKAGGCLPHFNSDGLVGKPGYHVAVDPVQHVAGTHVEVPGLAPRGQDGCQRDLVETQL